MSRAWLFALLLALAAPAGAVSLQKVVSPGGIEAWLVEDHSNPIIALHFSVSAGAASDPIGKEGLAAMVGGLLDEGAGDLDSQAFQERLDDLAISLSFSADRDYFNGQMKTLSDNRDDAFSLLGLALRAPRFDPDAVARVRGQFQAALLQEEQEPNALASRALSAALFPGHPYGRHSTKDSVSAIGESDLKNWLPSHLSRDHLVVGVVGDVTPAQLGSLLDSGFGALPVSVALPAIPEEAAPDSGHTQLIRRPIPQSVVAFGKQGIKRDDPDWYKAYVMNYILGGGGFSSRLMTEVRVKRGLAYGVGTALVPYRRAAVIEGEVATRNDKLAASLQVIRDEWRRMAASDVTADELRSAKTYLNGSFPLQMDSTVSIANLLVVINREHLGIDYIDRRPALINQVTAADIRLMAQRLLDPDKLTMVVVGDPPGTIQ